MVSAAMIELIRQLLQSARSRDTALLLAGRSLAQLHAGQAIPQRLAEVAFRVFSQFGDDGIIQFVVARLDIEQPTFIEFGVADYFESNTRFLLMNNNWSGFVMDSSSANVRRILRWRDFWKYDLQAKQAFVTRDNVNDLLQSAGFDPDIGLLHIDIDGNDYWIWEAITSVRPVLVIVEYNSLFGPEHALTIPYQADFDRRRAHFSGLYAGASLAALQELGARKGYAFIGCNDAGNNAYFVRRDRLGPFVERTVADGYVISRFRESRDLAGRLSFARGHDRRALIRDLPVYDLRSAATRTLRDLGL